MNWKNITIGSTNELQKNSQQHLQSSWHLVISSRDAKQAVLRARRLDSLAR
jgi:hypothetical protein